jgi:hypothetical protein
MSRPLVTGRFGWAVLGHPVPSEKNTLPYAKGREPRFAEVRIGGEVTYRQIPFRRWADLEVSLGQQVRVAKNDRQSKRMRKGLKRYLKAHPEATE